MGKKIVFCFKIGYAYKESGAIKAVGTSKGQNSMFLEAFFSTMASNILTEIFKRAIDKRLSEKDIEIVIERTLQKHRLSGQSSVIQREILVFLGNTGLVNSGGQLLLPSPAEIPALVEKFPRDWWDNRVYKIVSVYTEMVLDVPNTRTEDGTPIQLWDYHGGVNQQWKVIPVGHQENLFKIHSCYSKKVLDLPEPRMDDGTPIIQWGYYENINQQWRLYPIDRNGEIFKITSEWSGKSLDAPNTRTDSGTPIIQWDYHGGTNQQWRLMLIK